MSVERELWGNRLDFIISTVGYAVGLGNIWRFPYLCLKSGGGAFLIPYFIMLIFCGIPLFVMEVAIGQYTRQGPVGAMANICPLLTGAGVGVIVMAYLFCLYYNVVIGWALYYLYESIRWAHSGLFPWQSCGHPWNNEHCWDSMNTTQQAPNNSQSPTEQFYNHQVLQKTDGLHILSGFNIHLLVTFIVAWIIVYFALFKGIRWTGKVVYFTALIPYVILLTLLVLGCTLEGSLDGILFFISPRWEFLKKPQVWVDAAIQNFNSIGIAFGSLIAFSSYNKFHNQLVSDCLIVAVVNSMTSVLSGFIIFAALGHIAFVQNSKVEDVVAQGPGLVFIVYPTIFSKLPAAHLWAAVFFFVLVLLGIDSQFATMEAIITTAEDAFGGKLKRIMRRELLVLLICTASCIVGLPFVTKGGIYVFQLVNYFSSGISLMYLAFFECIAVVWFYGANVLSANMQEMTGRPAWLFFRICWYFVSPILILVMWTFTLTGWAYPTIGDYQYPNWGVAIGWIIAALSIIPIPIWAFIEIYRASGSSFVDKLRVSMRSPLKKKGYNINDQSVAMEQFSC